jgi:hypothetical protein
VDIKTQRAVGSLGFVYLLRSTYLSTKKYIKWERYSTNQRLIPYKYLLQFNNLSMKKLLLLSLASSVLFCDVSLAAQMRQSHTSGQNSDTLISQKQNESSASMNMVKATPVKSAKTIKFDAFMTSGYAAFDKKDYKTALTDFKSALALRPKNMYATKAIQNTEKKLAGK